MLIDFEVYVKRESESSLNALKCKIGCYLSGEVSEAERWLCYQQESDGRPRMGSVPMYVPRF